MGLDESLHIIYGYKLENTPIEDKMNELTELGKLSDEANDELYDNLTNTTEDGLTMIADYMRGKFEYIGIQLFYKYDDYGSELHKELDLNQLKEQCDDEKLDELIQKHLPFIVGDMYDVAGLMNGELPKLYFVKRVW